MKKNKIIIFSIASFFLILGFIIFSSNLKNSYISNDFEYEILSKNLMDATSFDFGANGNVYISYKDKIVRINSSDNSKEEFIRKPGQLIGDIKIENEVLYFILDDKLISTNLITNEEKVILEEIPNYGDVNKDKIFILDNILYLSIDAATNSGILEKSDLEKNPNNKGDIYPKEIKGDRLLTGEIPTASIIKIDLNTLKNEIYAYGIRNVLGMDMDSSMNIYVTVGGIEESGSRALYGDSDYIYILNNINRWYGWPDYSGGDRVDSPRFREEGKSKQKFILETHPSVPPAPFYQNDSINSFGRLLIDKNEVFGIDDAIIIYDKSTNGIIQLNKYGEKITLFKVNNSYISDMKFYNKNLYLLDTQSGYLIKLNNNLPINNKNYFLFAILSIIFSIMIISFIKYKKNKF